MSCFSEQDLQHLKAFPQTKKAEVLETIMARPATTQRNCSSHTEYDFTLMKLRKAGYRLIDFQPMETAFTSVWYRKSSRLLGLSTSESVVMLVWESIDQSISDNTTLFSAWEL